MRRGLVRSRWAAIGAAVAVTLGAGGVWAADALTAINPPAGYVPLSPARILDTRTGVGVAAAPIGANGEIVLQVTGAGGVPSDATSVVLNMTSVDGTAPSFITVYPEGEARPEASVLNVQPVIATPNMITAKLGANGRIRIYNFAGSVNVIADVAGYFHPVQPDTVERFGVFNDQGTLQGGNIAINMPRQSTGFYQSTLGGNFPTCSYTVSVNVDSVARYATVNRGTFPNYVRVYIHDGSGALVDAPFTLVMHCVPE